jgi:hypothetical protein
LITASREEADLSPSAIAYGIHHALIEKSYFGKSNIDLGALETFSDRLLRRIQSDMTDAIQVPMTLDSIEWDTRIFKPLVATFEIHEELGVCVEDAEYIFLIMGTLWLAYELLTACGKDKSPKIRTFLTFTFGDVFVEPEICREVLEVLEAERKRLKEASADMRTLNAVAGIQMLIPDLEACTEAWDASMIQITSSRCVRNNSVVDSPKHLSSTLRTLFPQSRCSEDSEATTTSRERASLFRVNTMPVPTDVHVRVFLKPGCSWSVSNATSAKSANYGRIIKKPNGIEVRPEDGSFMLAPAANCKECTLERPKGSIDGFTATIIIPPNGSYSVPQVIDVRGKAGAGDVTIIETAAARFEVEYGQYQVRRKDFGERVTIENTSY